MKLVDFKEAYQELSGKASDVARQLAFAGIAVVWIFKINDETCIKLPKGLLYPTLLFCFALACDLLQYYIAASIWGIFHRYHEKKALESGEESELYAPAWFNRPALTLFALKGIAVIISYIMLITYSYNTIFLV